MATLLTSKLVFDESDHSYGILFLPSFSQTQCRDVKMKEQLLSTKMGSWNPAVTPQNRHEDTESVFFYPTAQGRTSSIKNTFDTKPDCPR